VLRFTYIHIYIRLYIYTYIHLYISTHIYIHLQCIPGLMQDAKSSSTLWPLLGWEFDKYVMEGDHHVVLLAYSSK
jgi:hypothetical protein